MERSKRQQDYELEELNAYILDLQKQLNLWGTLTTRLSWWRRKTWHKSGTLRSWKLSKRKQLAQQPLLKRRLMKWMSLGAPLCFFFTRIIVSPLFEKTKQSRTYFKSPQTGLKRRHYYRSGAVHSYRSRGVTSSWVQLNLQHVSGKRRNWPSMVKSPRFGRVSKMSRFSQFSKHSSSDMLTIFCLQEKNELLVGQVTKVRSEASYLEKQAGSLFAALLHV